MQLHLLQSKTFILSLLLVLVNDFILKYNFPCWLTGKLSDFAGLFVFAIFWMALFPKKRNTIVWVTAIIFTWWKSPLSQPLIEYWNEIVFYSIHRVVDYSDLMALVVLPLTIKFCKSNNDSITRFRVSPSLMVGLSFFVFCSTSAIKSKLYQYPNPQVFAFRCEIDSSSVVEREIYTGRFERDSTNIFRLKSNDKIFFQQSSYEEERYHCALEGDSILLIKTLHEDYYEEYVHFRSNAGKVRFFDRIKNNKLYHLESILNQSLEVLAEEAEFPYYENPQERTRPKFKFFPISKTMIDSSMQVKTNQFGDVEIFHFKNSLLDGEYIRLWESTKVKVNGFYDQGLEVGTWEYFDSLEMKTKEEIYEKGELTQTKIFSNGDQISDKYFPTKKQVIKAHWISSITFILLLLVSLYFYKKWFKPVAVVKEKDFLHCLWRFAVSIAGGLVTPFFLFFFLLGIGSEAKISYWDLPFNFEDVLFPVLIIPIGISLYILGTNREKDILWLWLWIVLLFLLYQEYQYLSSY